MLHISAESVAYTSLLAVTPDRLMLTCNSPYTGGLDKKFTGRADTARRPISPMQFTLNSILFQF